MVQRSYPCTWPRKAHCPPQLTAAVCLGRARPCTAGNTSPGSLSLTWCLGDPSRELTGTDTPKPPRGVPAGYTASIGRLPVSLKASGSFLSSISILYFLEKENETRPLSLSDLATTTRQTQPRLHMATANTCAVWPRSIVRRRRRHRLPATTQTLYLRSRASIQLLISEPFIRKLRPCLCF